MPTMTVDDIRTRVESFLQAYNDHDVDAIVSQCTEDVVWEDPSLSEPLMGREPAAAMLRAMLTAFPDLHFPRDEIEIYRSLSGRRAASRWHMVATMTGRLDPPGWEPTGRGVEVSGMCAYEFRDGLIARHTVLYDQMSMSRQLGLMPGPDSVPVKAMVGLQRAQALGRKLVKGVRR